MCALFFLIMRIIIDARTSAYTARAFCVGVEGTYILYVIATHITPETLYARSARI